MKIKIYLYKDQLKQRAEALPRFVIETNYSRGKELFSKLYSDIVHGNTDYIFIENAIFQKNQFNFAVLC